MRLGSYSRTWSRRLPIKSKPVQQRARHVFGRYLGRSLSSSAGESSRFRHEARPSPQHPDASASERVCAGAPFRQRELQRPHGEDLAVQHARLRDTAGGVPARRPHYRVRGDVSAAAALVDEARNEPPHGEVAAAITTVRNSTAWPESRTAFEFLVLTARRSGEGRRAEWEEIDLESSI